MPSPLPPAAGLLGAATLLGAAVLAALGVEA